MRKIKFRAWHKDKKLMLNVIAINFELLQITTDIANKKIYPDLDYWWKETDIPFSEIEFMESTGLFDKNGFEIFEGDIVENTTQRVYLGHMFEVSWNCGYACFQLLNGGKSSNVPLIQDFMSYEVVGNIYENPELLEVEE